MHRLYLYLAIIFLLPLSAHSQKMEQGKQLTVRQCIQWEPAKKVSDGISLLYFEGAVNHDSLGFLPVFRYDVPGSSNEIPRKAELKDQVYSPLELDTGSETLDINLIGNEVKVMLSASTSGKISRNSVYILPVRKAQNCRGYEKLTSFTLEISFEVRGEFDAGKRGHQRFYAEHSVLQSGDWYRLGVRETGLHRITYGDLEAMGIDVSMINPRFIQLYGNGNGMLEEANSMPRPDDLMENAIFVSGEEDGKFDEQDYLLFFGEGPVVVRYNDFYEKFEHEINFYTDETCYFLKIGSIPGKRIQPVDPVTLEPTHDVESFEELVYYEKEAVNLIKSGKMWYGEVFSTQTAYDFPFTLKGIDLSEPIYLRMNFAGRSTISTKFNISVDGVFIDEVDLPSVSLGSQTYARSVSSSYEEVNVEAEDVNVGISFEKPGTIDMGWLNYIEINYIRNLILNEGQLIFRDMRVKGENNVARYHLRSSGPDVTVWEISDPANITRQAISQESGGYTLTATAEVSREFIAFNGDEYFQPRFIEKVANQDLHGSGSADFIIVVHPMFLDQAYRLADYHRQYDNMSVFVVTPQQIYNEFSSGVQDICAIRDYMKMLYDRAAPGNEPRYMMLFGDASYDYKDITLQDNNLVPAYQSRESLKYGASFVTDDFFGCLDEDEGSTGSGTMDIGIGRFPVNSLEQAEAMVNKSINYMSASRENFGPWRNSVCFIGDDEDNNTHLGQAEGLVGIADSLGPVFNINKIYLDAYPQLNTPGGTRYPDVNAAIDRAINEGCLIMNYTGHGGEIAWAAERVLDIPAIQSYRNINQLPAFVTATCEFSRYDDPSLVSAGELVFLNPDGAGIGLFTTSRLAFSQSNYALNKRFYYEAFRIDSLTGEYPRMGDLIRASKTPSNQNMKNFVLLGDPALMLAYPKLKVKTLSIVNEGSGRQSDTIHSLSKVTITGQIEDQEGNRVQGFNGIIHSTVFDKPVLYKTRGNDPQSRVTDFYIQDKVIFKGEASVANGLFSFTFVVPLDISYQLGEGKISYYALDTASLTDANGFGNVWIGGSDGYAQADENGPDIELFLNTLSFQSGDITTPDPILIARISDSSGINTVGNGIGHDIVAVIDGNYQEPVVLNDYFDPATDNYREGEIIKKIGPFANGLHTLTLKAWDVLNNSSEETIEFVVNVGARLNISNLQSRPNPYREGTQFVFEHNKPGSSLDIFISIFDLTGRLFTSLNYQVLTESAESGLLYWDGLDARGNELPDGIFVYTVIVRSDDGYQATLSQKLLHIK